MKRREFLKSAGIGLAASTAVAAPAIAQSMPEIKWRMPTSWPKSLDTLYGGCEYFAKRIAEMSDNKFQITVFAAGEIVPGLQVLDAVQNGNVEMGNTASYYYFGKDAAFTFGTALPFGVNTRGMNAWLRFGDGQAMLNELYAKYNCIGFASGNTGAQMGGFFRKEIKTIKSLAAAGAQLRPFSQPIMEACLKASNELYADISSKNADFKKVYDNMLAFRNDEYLWWQVAEYTYDSFMIRTRPRA